MSKLFKVLILSLVIFSQSLFANAQDDLQKHFRSKLDAVITIVKDKEQETDLRNEKIVDLLTPMFDFKLMAKLSLGKKTWMKLNEDDRGEFVELYVARMKTSYSSKLDSYKDEEVEIKSVERKKNRIMIATELVGDDESLKIVYKFYKPKKQKSSKDEWLVYDVEIIGISMLKADKAQFKEFLQTKTIQDLMVELAKKKKTKK